MQVTIIKSASNSIITVSYKGKRPMMHTDPTNILQVQHRMQTAFSIKVTTEWSNYFLYSNSI